jgi:hypothetical protein
MPPDQVYRIYGLRVRSDLSLPAMGADDGGEVDLTVRNCGVMPRSDSLPSSAVSPDWRQVEKGWQLRYQSRTGEALEFTFDPKGSRLDIRCTLPDRSNDIVAVLLGAPLAAALHLRGVPVLHASAVVIENRAILVVGTAGAGKSTLTAALVREGASFLSEDLAALAIGGHQILVQPGYPRMRLCGDALAVAGTDVSNQPRVFSEPDAEDKRWLDAGDLAGGLCATAAPLGAVYVLMPRDRDRLAAEIVPLPSFQASLALLAHLYGARWLKIPKAKALEWCARIAGQIPVRVVHAPPGLDRIRETAEAIVADSRRSSTGAQV